MGNTRAKESAQSHFTPEEQKVLEAGFKAANGGGSEKLPKEKLTEYFSSIIDAHLAQCTANFLFTAGAQSQQRVSTIAQRRFAEPFYIVERGTIDEKLHFLAGSLDKADGNQIAMKALETYVASVIKSYLNIQAQQNNPALETWKKHGYLSAERSILAFAKGLIRSLTQECEHRVDLDNLERWLQINPTFLMIWREVFTFLYGKQASKSHKLGNGSATNILPMNEGLANDTNYTPILDIPHVIFVNSNLPNEVRHKWRFLFSSKIMGESFSTMLGKITNKGPTLLIVEDEDRFIFGGYAPESWALRPTFVGDNSSVLLTLSPAMRCFTATGYNDHYQYLNLSQQTMPNGLGIGGQFDYWGLWLDSEYGLGQSSESCSTYNNYVQLSKRKEFRIRSLEVWAIGDEPKDDSDDEDEPKRSILDKNLEDRVMLELSGHQMHSDGLRDPDMDL